MGKGYRIYRNLNKNCFSIQSYVKGKGWRVTDYADTLEAREVNFVVYEADRQRCLREGRKNVHAFAVASVYEKVTPSDEGIKASYNPKVGPEFTVNSEVITWAESVELRDGKMFVTGQWR